MHRLALLFTLSFLAAPGATQAAAQDISEMAAGVPAATETASEGQALLEQAAGLVVEDVPLTEAIVLLGHRAGVTLAFSPTFIPEGLKVTCACEALSVKETLDRLLIDTELGYRVVGNHILIERETVRVPQEPVVQLARLFQPSAPRAVEVRSDRGALASTASRQGTIMGEVVDGQSLQPLGAAQVFVPGLDVGTITAADGTYQISDVPAGTHTVTAERIGYQSASQEVTVADGESVTVDFQLTSQAFELDELVVTGTAGGARVRELGTQVSRLDASRLENVGASRPQDLLMGRVAGASLNLGGGQPGTEASIRLRGSNSMAMGNQPLIYVDGVRIYSEHSPSGPSSSSGTLGLNSINPDDIERIEIVKGAAASTLYGTEASGGVIQIFTKTGLGDPVWQAEAGFGLHHLGHYGPLGGPGSSKSENPTGLYLNECRGPNFVDYWGEQVDDVTCPDRGSWTRNGPIQNYSLSVRGGAGDVSYYLSGFMNAEDGTAPDSYSRRGGFRANLGFEPLEDVELSWNNSYTRTINRYIPEGGNIQSFVGQATRGPAITYREGGLPAAGSLLRSQIYDWKDHYVTGLTVRYRQSERLNHRFVAGFDYNLLTGQDLYEFGNGRFPDGQMSARDWRNTVMSLDYSSTFTMGGPDGISSALSWGGQYFDNNTRQVNSSSQVFAGPGEPTLASGARREVSETRQRVVNAGLFVQNVLGIQDRLFITGGVRFDGNSAFGSDFGLQAYPKVSASYVISDHLFWPEHIAQSMRLRAAMGESGKAPGAFDAVRVWNPISADDGQPGYTPAALGNPNLGPERTREYELGFESSSLDGRLAIEFTWFQQNTMDALVPVQPPPSAGFLSSQLENVGEVQNSGIELTTDVGLVRVPGFDWSTQLTYSTVNSEVIDLGGRSVSLGSQNEAREGYPLPVFVGNKVMNADEYAMPILESDQVLGAVYPDKRIGIGTTVTLRDNLTLDGLGEFVLGGHNMYLQGEINARRFAYPPCWDIQRSFEAYNDGDTSALDDVTAEWRARCGGAFNSTWAQYEMWTAATDFFRLRNVSLSYRLPQQWIPGAESARLMVTGRNLLTRSDYIGVDPELNNNSGSGAAQREWSNWPSPRTFTATMSVTF